MAEGFPKNMPVTLPKKKAFPRPFGRYVLEKSLSRGGMGEIFLAVPKGVEAHCVIKTIRSDLTGEKEFIGRFADEAKIMMRIVHDNIIRIFDCGKVGSNYYIAMEFSHGKDLGDVLDRAYERAEPMPVAVGLYLTEKMLLGLDFIHNARAKDGRPMRLVHRDISPQNILIGFDGSLKLIDFGLARTELLPGRTQGQLAVGKYGYMSPEQARHGKIDGRADLYSLGVMLFEIFTSDRLVDEQDQGTLWQRVLSPKHRNPRSVLPSLSKEIDELVMNAVQVKPDRRFQSAQAMLDQLRRLREKRASCQELVEYMRVLYPRVNRSPPVIPDFSSSKASSHEESVIIAMSEDGAKSVFGRGQLPVEFTQQVQLADILPELERRRKEKDAQGGAPRVSDQTHTQPQTLKLPKKNQGKEVSDLVKNRDVVSFGSHENEDEEAATMIQTASSFLGDHTFRDAVGELHPPSLKNIDFQNLAPEIVPARVADKFKEDEATVMMPAPPSPGNSPFASEPLRFDDDAAEAATRVEEPVPATGQRKYGGGPRVIRERRALANDSTPSVTMRQTFGQVEAPRGPPKKHRSENEIKAAADPYSDDNSPNWMMGGLILLGLTIIVLLLVILLRP